MFKGKQINRHNDINAFASIILCFVFNAHCSIDFPGQRALKMSAVDLCNKP